MKGRRMTLTFVIAPTTDDTHPGVGNEENALYHLIDALELAQLCDYIEPGWQFKHADPKVGRTVRRAFRQWRRAKEGVRTM